MKAEQYDVHASVRLTHWWRYGTNTFFASLARDQVAPGGAILDHGCGVGDLVNLLKNDYRITGIDAFAPAVRYSREANRDMPLVQGDVMFLPFLADSFDALVSLDVLYHINVFDDKAALAEIKRVLKPGGRVFLQLPAYEWLRSGHDVVAMTHKRFTAGEIRRLLADVGLEPERVGYRVTFLFPFAAVARLLSRYKANDKKKATSDIKKGSRTVNAILKRLIGLENRLARYVNYPFGLSVVAIARKPG